MQQSPIKTGFTYLMSPSAIPDIRCGSWILIFNLCVAVRPTRGAKWSIPILAWSVFLRTEKKKHVKNLCRPVRQSVTTPNKRTQQWRCRAVTETSSSLKSRLELCVVLSSVPPGKYLDSMCYFNYVTVASFQILFNYHSPIALSIDVVKSQRLRMSLIRNNQQDATL